MPLLRIVAVRWVCAIAAAAQPPRMALPAGPPPGGALIWVLQPDNTLAAYSATDFRKRQTMALPPEARGHPERISIGRDGSVLVTYPAGENLSLRRLWQSDPGLSPSLTVGADDRTPAPGGGYSITSATPEVYFSSD